MAQYKTFVTDPKLVRGLGAGGSLQSFAALTQQGVIDFSVANKSPGNANGNFRDAGNQWEVSEDTPALYAQVNFAVRALSGAPGRRHGQTIYEQTH